MLSSDTDTESYTPSKEFEFCVRSLYGSCLHGSMSSLWGKTEKHCSDIYLKLRWSSCQGWCRTPARSRKERCRPHHPDHSPPPPPSGLWRILGNTGTWCRRKRLFSTRRDPLCSLFSTLWQAFPFDLFSATQDNGIAEKIQVLPWFLRYS